MIHNFPKIHKTIYKETYKGHTIEYLLVNYFSEELQEIHTIASQDKNKRNSIRDAFHPRKWEILKKRTALAFMGIRDKQLVGMANIEYADENLPSNLARILARNYTIHNEVNEMTWKNFPRKYWDIPTDALYEIPQYMQMYGFDEVFFTRHYDPEYPKKHSISYVQRYGQLKTKFKRIDKVKIYHSVPQYIYYAGKNPEIFEVLEDYE